MRPVTPADWAKPSKLYERVAAYLREPGPASMEGIDAVLADEEFAEHMEELLRLSATTEAVALSPDAVVWKPTNMITAAVCELSDASSEGGKL